MNARCGNCLFGRLCERIVSASADRDEAAARIAAIAVRQSELQEIHAQYDDLMLVEEVRLELLPPKMPDPYCGQVRPVLKYELGKVITEEGQLARESGELSARLADHADPQFLAEAAALAQTALGECEGSDCTPKAYFTSIAETLTK